MGKMINWYMCLSSKVTNPQYRSFTEEVAFTEEKSKGSLSN